MRRAHSPRELTFKLRINLLTWNFTVRSVMPKPFAISLLV
jgi:hypothetical protein